MLKRSVVFVIFAILFIIQLVMVNAGLVDPKLIADPETAFTVAIAVTIIETAITMVILTSLQPTSSVGEKTYFAFFWIVFSIISIAAMTKAFGGYLIPITVGILFKDVSLYFLLKS